MCGLFNALGAQLVKPTTGGDWESANSRVLFCYKASARAFPKDRFALILVLHPTDARYVIVGLPAESAIARRRADGIR